MIYRPIGADELGAVHLALLQSRHGSAHGYAAKLRIAAWQIRKQRDVERGSAEFLRNRGAGAAAR
jgi:hypothetical protein